MNDATYPGLLNDADGGLTHWGRVVMDAWVFGPLSESETCAGWGLGLLQALAERVSARWDASGGLPSRLPDHLRARHQRIYAEALARARAAGWQPPRRRTVKSVPRKRLGRFRPPRATKKLGAAFFFERRTPCPWST